MRPVLARWIASFVPSPVAVKWPERLRSGLGALLGIAFTGGSMLLLLGPSANIPLLVAPMGASAVLLFAVPASPLAQPWSIIGGNLVSATVGVACATLIADPIDAAALAIAIAICAMFALRCVHPPSGAVALTAVLGGPSIHSLGFRFVLEPIALQSFALLTAAIVFHALTGHRYPHAAGQNAAKAQAAGHPPANPGFTRADLDAVLARRDELLDIDPADLESVVNEAQMRAYVRTFDELTCADIMSHPVASIFATTTAATASDLLSRRAVKALPVVDTTQRVIGIVTRADLMQYGSGGALSALFRLPARWLANDDEATRTAGALMTTDVCTISAATPITELVPIFANFGHHHIPVLDGQERLVGMITQADVIAGLYRQTQQQSRQAA
ncbi:HPP family protein [Caballeronia telluris]|uniref:CBS domain-containing protein n=1 Tax=Caballeronia telluris TaxID=326475 RepID=A0A158H5F2_9BURK|nr:HPP family protein [Caballeronia telluris]SAL39377.1 CBS domain-containing protein [Caballeronia telluris]